VVVLERVNIFWMIHQWIENLQIHWASTYALGVVDQGRLVMTKRKKKIKSKNPYAKVLTSKLFYSKVIPNKKKNVKPEIKEEWR